MTTSGGYLRNPHLLKHYQQHAIGVKNSGLLDGLPTPKSNAPDGSTVQLPSGTTFDGIDLKGLRVTNWNRFDENQGVWYMKNRLNDQPNWKPGFSPRTLKHANMVELGKKPDADLDQTYFLPWDGRGGTVYMDLPPGGPDVFHTSDLSGCSVFVTGTPQNPRVYHCGVDGTLENSSPPQDVWRALVHRQEVNDGRPDGQVGEVNSFDYQKQPGQEGNAKMTERVKRIEDDLKVVTGDPNAKASPCGNVFGLKDSQGNWSFYLQENVVLDWKGSRELRPLQLTKFFPPPSTVTPSTWKW